MISLKRLAKLGIVPVLAGLAVASVTAIVVSPGSESEASSHREAPLIAADPLADTTDVYAFIAPDAQDKVTLVGNWIPLEEPAGGPNFYNFGDDVLYELDIDNNGDAKEDIAYAFHFKTQVIDPSTFLYATGPITSLDDPNFNIRQTYDVFKRHGKQYQLIASDVPVPPNNIGPTSTPNYDELAKAAVFELPGGGKVFAGQRDDPFFVDLGGVFDLATIRMLPGNNGGGIDGVGGFNTNSIVLQVPISDVTACKCDPSNMTMSAQMSSSAPTKSATKPATTRTPRATATAVASPTATPQPPSAIIGVWSDTYRNRVRVVNKDGSQDSFGKFRQVSRLGNPLVNEVVIPLEKKDLFNASDPKDDAQFLDFVVNSDLAEKLNAVYNGIITPIPETGRTDLVTVFLTGIPGLNQPANVVPSEQLRLNLAIKPDSCGAPKRLGVIAGDNCGFPNGRRLADDVTDIAIRAVACGYGFNLGPCVDSAPNNALGDGVDANDQAFLSEFPYVASPNSGFDHQHHTGVVVPVFAGLGGAGGALLLLTIGAYALSRLRRRKATDAV